MVKLVCRVCKGDFIANTRGTKYCIDCYKIREKENNKRCAIEKREGLVKVYGGKCLFCGNNEIELHHADMNKNNNNKLNFVPLCMICHKKVHSKILKPFLKRSHY